MTTLKKQNRWLDALIAALEAADDHRVALRGLIADHGNKRTLGLMEDLQAGFLVMYPDTPGEVHTWNGTLTLKFKQDSAAIQTWRRMITPHLPKVVKRSDTQARKVNPEKQALGMAKRMKEKYGKAFCRTLGALLLS